MRLESLNPNSFPSSSPMSDTKLEVPDLTNQVTQPKPIDPSFSVPDDVLLPESPIPTANTGGVQINVSTTPTPTPTLTPTPIAQTPQSI